MRKVLVLHLIGGGEPVRIALEPDGIDELQQRLREMVETATTQVVKTADGAGVVVNFAHVVTAHVEQMPALDVVYGSPRAQDSGFTGGKQSSEASKS